MEINVSPGERKNSSGFLSRLLVLLLMQTNRNALLLCNLPVSEWSKFLSVCRVSVVNGLSRRRGLCLRTIRRVSRLRPPTSGRKNLCSRPRRLARSSRSVLNIMVPTPGLRLGTYVAVRDGLALQSQTVLARWPVKVLIPLVSGLLLSSSVFLMGCRCLVR